MGIETALQLNTEIISADSRQIYRELLIGSSPPTPEQLRQVKHHFIGTRSVQDEYNAGTYGQDARKLLEQLFQQHDYIVLCGGSGLYIRAVCEGMDELPEQDAATRELLNNLYKEKGIEALHEQLLQLDPEYFHQVDLHNPQRLIRALEVCMLTGKTYSSLRTQTSKLKSQTGFRQVKIGLNMERKELYERINQRVDTMFEQGLEQEARSLEHLRHLSALQTVGYSELFDYFDRKCSLNEAKELIKRNSRRFAKRQLTWFRKDKEIKWLLPSEIISTFAHSF